MQYRQNLIRKLVFVVFKRAYLSRWELQPQKECKLHIVVHREPKKNINLSSPRKDAEL